MFEKQSMNVYGRLRIAGRVTGEADMTITAHTYRGRTLTPDHIVVGYRKRDDDSTDGPWEADGVTVSGYLHKRDGTCGVQRGRIHYFDNNLADAPRWVRDVAKDHRPDPLLDALTGPLTGPYGGPENKGKAGPDSDRRGALRLALSRLSDEQVATLATALTDAGAFVGEALTARIVARHKAGHES